MALSEPRKKALVIAVSEYDKNSKLNELPFCKNDGNEVHTLLKELGYEIKNSDSLIGRVDGTHMQDRIYDFFKDDGIKSDDTILFYFSGHGVPGDDDFFLASSNIDRKRPKMRGFSFVDLNGEITHCRAKKIVVILDSCYAGSLSVSGKGNESALASAAKNQLSATFKEGEGKCLLSSCMGFQESFATLEGDHSFFTNYLLKGLRGADGKSVDENGIVTPESLMSYIDREIDNLGEKRVTQTPFRKIESAGKIMLASHPLLVSANNAKLISEKRAKIRKMLADLLITGVVSERVVSNALAINSLELPPTSGMEKQQWDLLGRLLLNEVQVGEFTESWIKLEESLKIVSSERRDDEKKPAEKPKNHPDIQKFIAEFTELMSIERSGSAISLCVKMLIREPNNSIVLHCKGHALVHNKEFEEAVMCLSKSLKINPDNLDGLSDICYALFNLGRYDEALEYYDKVLQLDPNDSVVLLRMYNVASFLDKDELGMPYCDKALEANPKNLTALVYKGQILYYLFMYDEAMPCFNKALEIEPDNMGALIGISNALFRRGRYDETSSHLNKILQIQPNSSFARDIKEQILKKQKVSEPKTTKTTKPNDDWMPPIKDFLDGLKPSNFVPSGKWTLKVVNNEKKITCLLDLTFENNMGFSGEGIRLINGQMIDVVIRNGSGHASSRDVYSFGAKEFTDKGVFDFNIEFTIMGKIKTGENYGKTSDNTDVYLFR